MRLDTLGATECSYTRKLNLQIEEYLIVTILSNKLFKQTFYLTVFRHNVKNKNFRHENLNLYQIYEAETIDD